MSETRIPITMDKNFGELIHLRSRRPTGLIRLPDVRMTQRIALVEDVTRNHRQALEELAMITIRSGKIRISRQTGR